MRTEERYQDVLQNLEAVVVGLWRSHPDVTDYTVQRAYEAARGRYRAEATGRVPKPVELTGLDADLYAAIEGICEWRLGRRALDNDPELPSPTPLRAEELVECFGRLQKSVERWNRVGGRRGYLEFLSRFL
jgi:hypothetical protein